MSEHLSMLDDNACPSNGHGPAPDAGVPSLLLDLATLAEYPEEATRECLQACLERLRGWLPEAGERLESWRGYLDDNPLSSVQELYTQTFDLQPACSLDVGYYLFGEDYQRGLFLVKLRESQEEAGMLEEAELPDHLPVLLRWMARIHGSELHDDLVIECVLPVLGKMTECLAAAQNPYRDVMDAIARVLERDLVERGIAVRPAEWVMPEDARRYFAEAPNSTFRVLNDDAACTRGECGVERLESNKDAQDEQDEGERSGPSCSSCASLLDSSLSIPHSALRTPHSPAGGGSAAGKPDTTGGIP